MSRTGWLPVTAIAVLATIVIAVLASIGQERESSAEAFLQQALLSQEENDVSSSVLSTATGKVTMFNGDVYRRHTEAVRSLHRRPALAPVVRGLYLSPYTGRAPVQD